MRLTPLAIMILVSASLLAGCVNGSEDEPTPTAPPASLYPPEWPKLLCADGSNLTISAATWTNGTRSCNFEMTEPNIGNEVTIAVSRSDPKNVVGGAKDYTQPAAGQCVWDGIYSTTDGGATWTNQQVPGSNWERATKPTAPVTPLSKHWCATDPVVAAGDEPGEFYYAAMGYQCDPVSASPTGDGVLPMGGLNDWAFNCVQMYVLRSSDGGVTWPQITPLEPAGSFPALFHDREWLEVGNDGTVYIGWIAAGNWFYYSSDNGRTFNGPIVVSSETDPATGQKIPAGGGQGTMIATGPSKEVYVSWRCGETTMLGVSRDGGRTFDDPVEVPTSCNAKVLYPSPENGRGLPRTPDAAFPAVDDSTGPYSGRVYFASRTDKFGHADIGLTYSSDQGKTWSPLARLNDDADDKGTAQFFAAISVNPHGVVDVIWYDQRRDPDHHKFDLYYTYSLDGGETWAPNARVTEVNSAPEPSKHQNGMVFIGDYIDLDSSDDYAHPVWVDTRNGVADVYTAWIERPSHPVAG